MTMLNDFCVFILTHKRPDIVITDKTLRKCGYTGKIYYVIDDEDPTASRYYENFGEQVLMFSKEEIEKTFDTFDNFGNRNTITHARNACFDLARQVGVTYFMQLDDDYTRFGYRFDNNRRYLSNTPYTYSLDAILDNMLDYYKSSPLLTLALSQGGDWIGGEKSTTASAIKSKRKAMNSFICSIDREFKFVGTMNEDVNTYTSLGNRGSIFLTVMQAWLQQKETQSQQGGITDLYKKFGTYVKSFYTVMACPSSVRVSVLQGDCAHRIHHNITWDHTVPKILRESVKRG